METRLPAAIDALVAAFQAAGLTARDGPLISGDFENTVYVGYDADPDRNPAPGATSNQEWAGVGQRKRNETNIITCAAVTGIVGDDITTWKAARDTAYAMIETVGHVLRTDALLGPALGLSPPSIAELWPGDYYPEWGPQGYQVRVLFTIHHKTRV